ncbi:MAG: ABC transporter substrate-binding protein, partial [Longimicrobiales bacterium]
MLPIAACGGDGGGSDGGTIVVGMRSDFGGFNPITSDALYSMELLNYALFTPLIQYDENLGVQPYLAESWEEQGDTAVVFTLRRDVTWHDGRAVTAEDVKFTFDRAKLPESASLIGSAFLAEVESATVIDSFTVRFDYGRPHAQALEDFWWAPAPKHLLENIAPAEMRNAPYNRAPVGSGPYRLTQWEANRQLVLEPYAAFPESLDGPPTAQRIVFRVIPEAATMLTELLTGGVHVDIPVMPDQASQIDENEATELYSFPGRTVYYIGWNNRRAPFDDVRVRRALALAIDRQEIIDALLYGQGQIATSTVPPWHPLYPDDIQPLGRDLAAAQQLLEEAGWRDANNDGVREKDGRPFEFELLTSDDALRRAVSEVVQAQLSEAGVRANIRVTEFQTMLTAHRSRDFDAVFT